MTNKYQNLLKITKTLYNQKFKYLYDINKKEKAMN